MHYDPEYLLKRFTDHFKQKYKVECISALHHNKRKTNYHIHLIFAERQLLDKPVEKIATRNMFYDEMGKHRRTKKEILDEAGNIRKRCRVVRKGEMYERKLFTKKNELFKADGYLDEVKRVYTDLINTFAIKEEDKLHVFEKNGMYLATKKVGKNNPKAAEIEADNKVRMQWNQTVDRALISGGAKKDILDVKREKISEEVKHSIEIYGNRPFFLADIIILAIKALELLISKVLLAAAKEVEKVVDVVHEKVVENDAPITEAEIKPELKVQESAQIQLPKKPEKPLLLSKYSAIMDLDAELKRRNDEIFRVERERSNLEIELSECSGVFKQKRRKELQEQISILDGKAEKMKAELSRMIQDAGYANASEFYTELFMVREEKRKYDEACKYHAWRWSRQKIVNESYNLIVLPNSSGGYEVYTRIRDFNTTLLKDLITNVSNGDTEVQKLFGGKKYFDYPKSVDLLKILIGAVKDKDALILDFFSGSATTAHATMQLNREDGGNRQYIMVQIPDGIDEKSEAYKDGYHNLCEIGKERIRLAGAEIKEADIGFRVLKLDSSNMKDIYYNPAQIQQQSLFDSTDNIKEDRTPEDLLFQVMLDLGILLSSKIEEKTIAGKKVFNVADGFLIACFDNDVTEKTVKAVAQEKPYYAVFRDSSMANDSVATNFEQIFATYSPETVRKVL